jgi:hypothetical protein
MALLQENIFEFLLFTNNSHDTLPFIRVYIHKRGVFLCSINLKYL